MLYKYSCVTKTVSAKILKVTCFYIYVFYLERLFKRQYFPWMLRYITEMCMYRSCWQFQVSHVLITPWNHAIKSYKPALTWWMCFEPIYKSVNPFQFVHVKPNLWFFCKLWTRSILILRCHIEKVCRVRRWTLQTLVDVAVMVDEYM
jgi:hypothetical protein